LKIPPPDGVEVVRWGPDARSVNDRGEEEGVLEVERWAEIRRMRFVERLSIREIARRTGNDRKTVQRAIRSDAPPAIAGRRPARS
jgi:hypothetical protein